MLRAHCLDKWLTSCSLESGSPRMAVSSFEDNGTSQPPNLTGLLPSFVLDLILGFSGSLDGLLLDCRSLSHWSRHLFLYQTDWQLEERHICHPYISAWLLVQWTITANVTGIGKAKSSSFAAY